MRQQQTEIDHLEYMIKQNASERVYSEKYTLDHILESMKISIKNLIQRNQQYLDNTDSLIRIVDPINTLNRGFSIIKQEGKAIGSVKDIDTKKEIEIVMKDGSKKV